MSLTLLNSISATVAWAFALLCLVRLLWPDHGTFEARALEGLAAAFLCIFLGTIAFLLVGHGNRVWLAISPFPFALAWNLANRKWSRGAEVEDGGDRVLFSLILALAFCLATGAIWLPPFQYDVLLYHLPAAALAFQTRSLFLEAAHPQIGTNPLFAELPKVWAYAFAGDDGLSSAQQIPYLVGLALVAYLVARQIGAKKNPARLAAFAVFLLPKAAEQAMSGNVDLIVGFWGAFCAWSLSRKRFFPLLAGILLLAQLKYSSLVPGIFCGLCAAYVLWQRSRKEALLWLALLVTVGGFWEWKNLFAHGNPTTPYQWSVKEDPPAWLQRWAPQWFVRQGKGDPRKWEGYYLNHTEAAPGTEPQPWPLKQWNAWADAYYVPYDRFSARWGPAWFALALPALFFFLLSRYRRGRQHRRSRHGAFVLALVIYLLTVKSWEARFGFVLVPFGFAAFAWALSLGLRFWRPHWVYVPVVFCLGWAGSQIFLSHPNLMVRAQFGAFAQKSTDVLPLTSRDPRVSALQSLANALDQTKADSVWIDFTHGEEHEYGLPATLLYPFFSPDWQRRVRIVNSVEITSPPRGPGAPKALVVQTGSRWGSAALFAAGYRMVRENALGTIYIRD